MDLDKARRIVGDLARVNLRYLRDGTYRNDIRSRLGRTASGPDGGLAERERQRVPAAARPYEGLVETSLALAGISTTVQPAEVVVVLDDLRPGAAFAGVHTALAAAFALGDRMGRPVTVATVRATSPGASAESIEALIAERFPATRDADGRPTVRVVPRERILDRTFSTGDVWLATHWKTAHAIEVAVRSGVIAHDRVAYLVQDYEPGFSPWSTEYAVAASTYRAGFRLLVNSAPLQQYLRDEEHLEVPDALTFGPHLDLDLLRRVADRRRREEVVRVLFYGRPAKHRNLFRLGVAALRIAAQELAADGIAVEFHSAGERHRDVDLGEAGGGTHRLVSHGTMPWDDYFAFIASTNVVLSLQHSPHPSHPPFDGAISGARVVTNDFGGTRAHLHPNLAAVAADPEALGHAVAEAVRATAAHGPTPYTPLAPHALGGPLEDAVTELARLLAPAPAPLPDPNGELA